MAGDVQDYVANCQSCLRARARDIDRVSSLGSSPRKSPRLLSRLTYKVRDLGPDLAINSFFFITDRFTKFTRAILLRSTTSQVVTDSLPTYRAYIYRLTDRVLTDNGKQFTARYFLQAMACLNIKHVPTSTYHPQTNGHTERYNSTLITRLRLSPHSTNATGTHLSSR